MKDFIKRHREIVSLIGITIACVISLWVSGETSLSSPKELGLAGMSIFQAAGDSIGTFFGNTFTSIEKLSALQTEHQALLNRMASLEAQSSDASTLRAENQRLREVLGFSGALSFQNIPSQLIAKSPGPFFASLTINKGFNQGIRRGMPVITMQDASLVLVGKIALVSPESAVIQPIFSDSMYITARLDVSRFEGLIRGSGFSADPLIMQYVSLDAQSMIKVGDLITSSGVNSRYPGGLKIGTVQAVTSRPYENTLEIEVKTAVDFARLEYMYVLMVPESDVEQNVQENLP
jgi:rod shape-determining protein MreC